MTLISTLTLLSLFSIGTVIATSLSSQKGTETSKCPTQQWVYRLVDDSCYLYNDQRVTWGEGMTYCKQKNSNLVSISDVHTNNFVSNMSSNQPVWIGLYSLEDFRDHRSGDNHPILTVYRCSKIQPNVLVKQKYGMNAGEKLPVTRNWRWMDNTPFSFSVWSHGDLEKVKQIYPVKRFPSPICTDPCCGVFMDREGMWRDLPLSQGSDSLYPFNKDDLLNGVVCQMRLHGSLSREKNQSTVNETSLNNLHQEESSQFTQLINWNKDIDWMDRVIYEKMGHFDNKEDVTQDYLRSLTADVKELTALMFVVFLTCLMILVLFSLFFITRLRKKNQHNRRSLRGFYFRGLSVSSEVVPDRVRFKRNNNNQEEDLLTGEAGVQA